MIYKISKAINSIRPKSKWTLNGTTYSGLVWLDEEQEKPTEQEFNDAIQNVIDDEELNSHRKKRIYPPIVEQLDMLWHAIDTNSLNKTSDFYKAIKAVKDAYPKSE